MASETDHGEALAGAHARHTVPHGVSDRCLSLAAYRLLRARTHPHLLYAAAFSAAGSSDKIPAELKEVLNEVGLTGKCR